jgi:hypothetical protein
MDAEQRKTKLQELEQLRARVATLERELNTAGPAWEAPEFYVMYFATAGAFLGIFAAAASLLFNVLGSLIVGQHPLKLIQIYLTFPLGERALELDGGLTLALGCCLYLATGMALGVPFYVLLRYFTSKSSLVVRVIVACLLALSMWFVHFYMILNWLQPQLIGGNWIVEMVPPWIGALTHLSYGLAMVAAYPLGDYTLYHRQTDVQPNASSSAQA